MNRKMIVFAALLPFLLLFAISASPVLPQLGLNISYPASPQLNATLNSMASNQFVIPPAMPVGASRKGLNQPLFSPKFSTQGAPEPDWDEQIGFSFYNNYNSLTFNVIAVAQNGTYGYGPAYLLNGVTPTDYWYQVGLSYNWPGGTPGFAMGYDVFNPFEEVVLPSDGGGGAVNFSGPVNIGDKVELSLYFSNNQVYMYAYDWNTTANAIINYSAEGQSYFAGLTSSSTAQGFFSGPMTEQYHVSTYTGATQAVTYSASGSAVSPGYAWSDEWAPSNGAIVFAGCDDNCQAIGPSSPALLRTISTYGARLAISSNGYTTGNDTMMINTQSYSESPVDAGESTTMTAGSILNGSGSYTYQWYEEAPGSSSYNAISGAKSPTYTFSTGTPGAYAFKVLVNDSPTSSQNSEAQFSSAVALNVTPAYTFNALIGSVLNAGILTNLSQTRNLVSNVLSPYGYPDPNSAPYPIVDNGFVTSAYAGISINPETAISASTNGGGASFTHFTSSSEDNLLRLSSTQVSGLLTANTAASRSLNNESEYLWIAGFAVYDQATGLFSLIDANGAYQSAFGNPIAASKHGKSNYAAVRLLGQNWTVFGMSPPSLSGTGVSSSNFVIGGNVLMAQQATQLTTLYLHDYFTNLTTTLGGNTIKIYLQGVTAADSNGLSNAQLQVYKNNALTNNTVVGPSSGNLITAVNAGGTQFYIFAPNATPTNGITDGYAKVQILYGALNVTSGKNFDSTGPTVNGLWLAALRWTTNQSSSAASQNAFIANAALQSIIIYSNQSNQQVLTPGSSLTFIPQLRAWNLSFNGESLGASGSITPLINPNYKTLDFIMSGPIYTTSYSNVGGGMLTPNSVSFTSAGKPIIATTPLPVINATVVTEPTSFFEALNESSPTNTIFTAAGGLNTNTLLYIPDPYVLDSGFTPNSVNASGTVNLLDLPNGGMEVEVTAGSGLISNTISSNDILTVQIYGHRALSSGVTEQSLQFSSISTSGTWRSVNGIALSNITNILAEGTGAAGDYAIPNPGIKVAVYLTSNTAQAAGSAAMLANSVELGTLSYSGAPIEVNTSNIVGYYRALPTSFARYNADQIPVNFTLSESQAPSSQGRYQYFTYNVPETDVPGYAASNSVLQFGITNSSIPGVYLLNLTSGFVNASAYISTQGSSVKAASGFRTEDGSAVTFSEQTYIFDTYIYDAMAYYESTTPDLLNFAVTSLANLPSNNTLHVYPTPSVVLSASTNSITIGQNVIFTANTQGGLGTFLLGLETNGKALVLNVTGSNTLEQATFLYTPNSIGNLAFNAVAIDTGTGYILNSTPVRVKVMPIFLNASVVSNTETIAANTPLVFNYTNSATLIRVLSQNSVTANIVIKNLTANTIFTSISSPTSHAASLILNTTVSAAGNSIQNISIIAPYPCSAYAPAPYELVAGAWQAVSGYTSNSTACTLNFTVSPDPVVGIFASTPPSSGGGGGGGGGSGGGVSGVSGGGGIHKPTITQTASGYNVTSIAQLNTFSLFFGALIEGTENFITPTSAGVTLNNASYTLELNQPQLIGSNSTSERYVKLTNVSYLPLEQTIALDFYSIFTGPSTTASTTTSTVASTSSATSTASTTINASAAAPIAAQNSSESSPPSQISLSTEENIGFIVGAIIVIAALVFYDLRKPKGDTGQP